MIINCVENALVRYILTKKEDLFPNDDPLKSSK